MTGYGFTGPMTARGTLFDAKEAGGASQVKRGRRARGCGRHYGRKTILWMLFAVGLYGL